jgi:hypothetical protein
MDFPTFLSKLIRWVERIARYEIDERQYQDVPRP